jgi:hypothetical protein
MNPRAILLCATALIFLAGCAHRLQFHVVDASSGDGLANVNVKVRAGSSYFDRERPHEHTVGLTDTNGFIIVSGVSSKQVIFFDRRDYRGASAGFVGRGRIGFSPFPPLDVDTMWREQKVVGSHGVIVIPLLPKQR